MLLSFYIVSEQNKKVHIKLRKKSYGHFWVIENKANILRADRVECDELLQMLFSLGQKSLLLSMDFVCNDREWWLNGMKHWQTSFKILIRSFLCKLWRNAPQCQAVNRLLWFSPKHLIRRLIIRNQCVYWLNYSLSVFFRQRQIEFSFQTVFAKMRRWRNSAVKEDRSRN